MTLINHPLGNTDSMLQSQLFFAEGVNPIALDKIQKKIEVKRNKIVPQTSINVHNAVR